MTLKQTVQKFKEQRKNVLSQMYIYQRKLDHLNKRNFEDLPLDIIDLTATIELLDQKQILLDQFTSEIQQITQL